MRRVALALSFVRPPRLLDDPSQRRYSWRMSSAALGSLGYSSYSFYEQLAVARFCGGASR